MRGSARRARAVWRFSAGVATVLLGLLLCAVAFPLWGEARRMRCVCWWSRRMLVAVGVKLELKGTPSDAPVLVAANHVSWLDILAIDAVSPARFVSKAEVRRWPLVGWLAASGGTLFIERARRRDSLEVGRAITAALHDGQRVAVFPEGTVGNGRELLPFHGNLLQAAIAAKAPLQPVALRYTEGDASHRRSSRAVAYDGDITIVQSVARVLTAEGLQVTLQYLPVIDLDLDRRALAMHVRATIAEALVQDDEVAREASP